MIRMTRGARSISLWIGPLYFYICGRFPGLYWFSFQFEVQDTFDMKRVQQALTENTEE